MRAAIFVTLLSMIGLAYAQDMNTVFQQGKDLGSAKNQGMFDSINSGSASDKVPSYGTSPIEAQYFMGGKGDVSGAGVGKIQSCASYTPGPDKRANQECEAVNLLARNPQVRPQFNISKDDPIFNLSKSASANAESFFQSLGIGISNSQCTTKTETTPAQYTTETCSSIKEINTQQCTMGRVVNIDTDANFQCEQTIKAYETLKCRRGSQLICTGGGDGCDRGGIVPNSWTGDMITKWFPDGAGNYILQFGTIADNYWCGYGLVQDRTLTFTIQDVGLITRFSLTRAAFDDWIMVMVNGHLIGVGPYGGDRLDIVEQCAFVTEYGTCQYYRKYVQYCATCFGNPELGTSWNITGDLDLRPYLRNGTNTIFMRVIVAGCGEGAIQITTRQVCPLNCSVSTNNQCAALEARAR